MAYNNYALKCDCTHVHVIGVPSDGIARLCNTKGIDTYTVESGT